VAHGEATAVKKKGVGRTAGLPASAGSSVAHGADGSRRKKNVSAARSWRTGRAETHCGHAAALRDGGVPRLQQKPCQSVTTSITTRGQPPPQPLPPGWPNRCGRTSQTFDPSPGLSPLANVIKSFAVSTAGRSEKISACADFSATDSHPFLIFAGRGAS